jgi:hypothetical protein
VPEIVPLTPEPDPPEEHFKSVVRVRIGRQRFELRVAVEAREITRGPAEVIEMPQNSKSSPA